MASLGDLFVTVGAKIDGFEKAFGEVESRLKAVDQEAKKAGAAFEAIGGKLTSLGTSMTIGVTAPLAGLGLAVAQVAGKFEQTEMAFKNFLGSGEAATKFLNDLKAFAASTPFDLPGLTDSAKKMMAFGFESERVIPMLRIIGDAVAGIGGGAPEIDRVTRALGQMQAKGKVSAEEMNQLAELGLPVWRMLAEQIGVSIPQAMKMAEQGAISAAQAIPAILEGMSKQFGGLMEDQSRTLLGMWSNFKDQVTLIMLDLGKVLLPAFKDMVTAATPFLEVLKNAAAAFAALDPETQKFIVGAVGIVAAAGPVIVVLGQMVTAIGALITAKTALIGYAGIVSTKFAGVASAALSMKAVVVAAATAINASIVTWAKESGEAVGDVLLASFGRTNDKMAEVGQAAGRMASAVRSSMAQQVVAVNEKESADSRMRAEMQRVQQEAMRVQQEMQRAAEAQAAAARAAQEKAEKAAALKARLAELTTTNRTWIAQMEQIQTQMGSTNRVIETMALDAEILTNKVNAATAAKFNLQNVAVPAWLNVADAAAQVPPVLDKVKEEVAKQPAAWDTMGRQVSTIVTRFSQDIAKSIFDGDMSWGERTIKMLKDIGAAVVSAFIEPAVNAITGFVTGTINGLLRGALDNVGQWLGSLGTQVAGIFGGGASAASGAAGAAGSVGGAAGGAASGAASGVVGIVGAVGSVVSAISGVIGNFQMAGMNRTLDLIEWNTRKSSLHLEHMFPVLYDHIDTFRNHWNAGLGIFNAAGDSGIRLAPYEFGAFPVKIEGEGGGVNITIEGNVIGTDDAAQTFADIIAAKLRAQGAI